MNFDENTHRGMITGTLLRALDTSDSFHSMIHHLIFHITLIINYVNVCMLRYHNTKN